jgi:hypothetical protein
VDESRRKVEGVPTACTGPLSDDDNATDDDDVTAPAEMGGRDPVRRVTSYGDVICQLAAANTRVMEKTLGQIGTVMSGVANLLHAVHHMASRTSSPPPLPPEPVGEVTYDDQRGRVGAHDHVHAVDRGGRWRSEPTPHTPSMERHRPRWRHHPPCPRTRKMPPP